MRVAILVICIVLHLINECMQRCSTHRQQMLTYAHTYIHMQRVAYTDAFERKQTHIEVILQYFAPSDRQRVLKFKRLKCLTEKIFLRTVNKLVGSKNTLSSQYNKLTEDQFQATVIALETKESGLVR